MDRELIKTDKAYRRKILNIYLTAVAFIIAFWRWILPVIVSRVLSLPNKERVEVLELIAHTLLLLFFPAALYCILTGRKICKYEAMPFPGMKVIRDTVVIRGKKALFRGRCMVALGTAMIIIAIASMFVTHTIILQFKQHPLFRPVFYQSGIDV